MPSVAPQPGVDYPRSFHELTRWLPDDEASLRKDRSSYGYDAQSQRLRLKIFAVDPGDPGRAIDWEELKVEPATPG